MDRSVLIDPQGVMRPLAEPARKELSAKKGRYDVLECPPDVLLLRAADPSIEHATIRLAGEITAPTVVCDVFAVIAQLGWRGALVLSDQGTRRSLFFEDGKVLGGETNVARERLGAVMYQYGVITGEEQERIVSAAESGGRFGALAVELGITRQEDVYRCLRHQVEEIAFASFALSSGTFFFFDGFERARLVSHQRIPAQSLVLDGVTRMDEIRYFREVIPSQDYIPLRTSLTAGLSDEYGGTYNVIDGAMSVAELGRLTGRGEFAITRDVFGLAKSGHVKVVPPKSSSGRRSAVGAFNQVLACAFRAAGAELKEKLRNNLASFASVTGAYGHLFAEAGPEQEGTLHAGRLLENMKRFHADDTDGVVRKMLHDYASFAIFCVGSELGPVREEELNAEVAPAMDALRPD